MSQKGHILKRLLTLSCKLIPTNNARAEVMEFLHEGGFRARYVDNNAILDKLTCISKMHLNKGKIKQILKRYQACLAES